MPQPGVTDHRALDFVLKLCGAIEAFVAGTVTTDPDAFRSRGVDLRRVVERHLYFALANNEDLYGLFLAHGTGGRLPRANLSPIASLVAPYLVKGWRPHDWWRETVRRYRRRRDRWMRQAHRDIGAAIILTGDLKEGAPVLFFVMQAKFIDFLVPVAEELGLPYAFAAFNDPAMFEQLAARKLPRVHIGFDAAGSEALRDDRFGYLEFFSTYLNVMSSALKQLHAVSVVVPEGNAPANELVNRAAGALGIPSVCIQQGWSPIVHNGFRHMSYTTMCVWGQGFADLLKPYNPDQHFAVTGNYMLNLSPGGSEISDRSAIGFFLQKGTRLISDEAWDEMLAFTGWTAARFPQREVRVREHPGGPLTSSERERLCRFPNLRLMSPKEATLNDVLEGCAVAVAIFSTTILEAAASGAVPLIVNVTGLPHYYPDIASEGAAIEVKDFSAARDAMVELLENERHLSALKTHQPAMRQRFFPLAGNPARAAVVEAIRAEIL